jgi:hypothetical protein
MSVVMLGLPLTSVMLPTLLLLSDGIAVLPLVIVAVVVAYVTAARIVPATGSDEDRSKAPRPGAAAGADRTA